MPESPDMGSPRPCAPVGVTAHPEGAVLEVSVRPKGGRCRVAGASGGRVRVEVTAAPEGGRATREAVQTLARALGVPVSAVTVLRGERFRHKTVLVRGVAVSDCLARLGGEPP